MPSFNIVETTQTGKAKVEYKGIGTTGYRDLNTGEKIIQQQFAGSKGGNAVDVEVKERNDDGTFKDVEVTEKEDDDVGGGGEPKPEKLFRSIIHKGYTSRNSNTSRDCEVKVWLVTDEPHDFSRVKSELKSSLGIENTIGANIFDSDTVEAKEVNEEIDADEYEGVKGEVQNMIYYKDQEYVYNKDKVEDGDGQVQSDLGQWDKLGGEPNNE